ncbi:prostaglandin D2 receptor 2 [Denticeps clupeoides]|uniref:G-protein coupled receptors family 1 profile domain-containing protein n=1 Tax=Denticeps clupeoides TaxID=299321 RepID=A0AAY3ZY06_9TELE|nr:prostaglandin D2 receptor 2-like [Denticeps clupeoides]
MAALNASAPQEYCPLLKSMLNQSLDTNVTPMLVSILGLVSCVGILENALILWVLGFRLRRKTVAAIWVINLAMSDFLATLTLPLFTHYLHKQHSWELGRPLCSIYASIFFLNMFVSAFLLAAISLDRCMLITRPVWSQNHRSVAAAWKICAIGWSWAAFNSFPYFFFRDVTLREDKRNLCYHNFALYSAPGRLASDCQVRQTATAVSKFLLAFVFPLAVIAASYIHFGISLRARNRRRQRENSGTFLSSSGGSVALSSLSASSGRAGSAGLSRSFTKMVVTVITAFILCWAPYHVLCLMEVVVSAERLELVEKVLPMATTFSFLNPILNPVLYAFSSPHFFTRFRQNIFSLLEGLVDEGNTMSLAGGILRRKTGRKKSHADVNSPTMPSSPDTGSINRFPFPP